MSFCSTWSLISGRYLSITYLHVSSISHLRRYLRYHRRRRRRRLAYSFYLLYVCRSLYARAQDSREGFQRRIWKSGRRSVLPTFLRLAGFFLRHCPITKNIFYEQHFM